MGKIMNIRAAIHTLKSGAHWTLETDNYDDLVWLDDKQSKPTKLEVEIKLADLEQEFLVSEIKRKRALHALGNPSLFYSGIYGQSSRFSRKQSIAARFVCVWASEAGSLALPFELSSADGQDGRRVKQRANPSCEKSLLEIH